MTSGAEQYPFLQRDPGAGTASLMPYLPITLSLASKSLAVSGLVDTGAAVNVLPYSAGVQLGGTWHQQRVPMRLTGKLELTIALPAMQMRERQPIGVRPLI